MSRCRRNIRFGTSQRPCQSRRESTNSTSRRRCPLFSQNLGNRISLHRKLQFAFAQNREGNSRAIRSLVILDEASSDRNARSLRRWQEAGTLGTYARSFFLPHPASDAAYWMLRGPLCNLQRERTLALALKFPLGPCPRVVLFAASRAPTTTTTTTITMTTKP